MLLAVLAGRESARTGQGRGAEGGWTEEDFSDDPFLNSFSARCNAEHPSSSLADGFCELDDTVGVPEGTFSPLTGSVGRKFDLFASKFDLALLCCVAPPNAV